MRHSNLLALLVVLIAPGALCGAVQKSSQPGGTAPAQRSASAPDELDALDEQLKKKKKKKGKARRDDFEVIAVRTSPSDSIAYVKRNHWTMFHLDVVANNGNHDIEIRSEYTELVNTPHKVRSQRSAQLVKGQAGLRPFPVFLTDLHKPKEVDFAVYRPGGVVALLPPGIETQAFQVIDPGQFLIAVLSADALKYGFLHDFQCVTPGVDEQDGEPLLKRRYFHLILPYQPRKPLVADMYHGWTSTSHLIWDGLDPELLSERQQEAFVDWLYWGGQLIISGGSNLIELRNSFLGPFLPAVSRGGVEVVDLSALQPRYLSAKVYGRTSDLEVPIKIDADAPIYCVELDPDPQSVVTEAIEHPSAPDGLPITVERTVGRGRIVMAAFSLFQPELVSWTGGYDTFWRTRLLDVPETVPSMRNDDGLGKSYTRLGPDQLTGLRYLARDLPPLGNSQLVIREDRPLGDVGVAEWRDDKAIPMVAKESLLSASGIEIPQRGFVFKAALAYLLALVPVNWFVFRVLLRRVELCWLAAPVITIAFSVGIMRLAEREVGLDAVHNEIDVLEVFPDYPRGHLSRFICIYSGSRKQCEFTFDDRTALAVPMAVGMQRGAYLEGVTINFGAQRVTLGVGGDRFEIDPRSIGLVRSEQMAALNGVFMSRSEPSGTKALFNLSPYPLWDAHLVTKQPNQPVERQLVGDVLPGFGIGYSPGTQATAEILEYENEEGVEFVQMEFDQADRKKILREGEDGEEQELEGITTVGSLAELSPADLFEVATKRPLGAGQWLIGWMPSVMPGCNVTPSIDIQRGLTVVVVNLESGPRLNQSSPAVRLFPQTR